MGNRYKRMTALGMASFMLMLAWVYCVLAFRTQTVWIAVISVALAASLYICLLAAADIRTAKEAQTQERLEKLLQDLIHANGADRLEDMERLAKASYIQQRKTNTFLSAQTEQMDVSVKKAVKLMIQYDRKKAEEAAFAEAMEKPQDHTALVIDQIEKLTGLLQSDMQTLTAQLQAAAEQLAVITEQLQAGLITGANAGADAENGEPASNEESRNRADVIPFPQMAENGGRAEEPEEEQIPEPEESRQEQPESEPEEPVQEQPESEPGEPIQEPAEPAGDPNRMLTPEEIAAMFAAAGGENAEQSEEEPGPEDPVQEQPESEPEEPTQEPAGDPNRMLTPEEIAALFASAQ